MMTVFILTLVIVVLIVVGMSVGNLFGRGPIKGSCGGMSALGIDTACDICGGNPSLCDEEQERLEAEKVKANNFYDASDK